MCMPNHSSQHQGLACNVAQPINRLCLGHARGHTKSLCLGLLAVSCGLKACESQRAHITGCGNNCTCTKPTVLLGHIQLHHTRGYKCTRVQRKWSQSASKLQLLSNPVLLLRHRDTLSPDQHPAHPDSCPAITGVDPQPTIQPHSQLKL